MVSFRCVPYASHAARPTTETTPDRTLGLAITHHFLTPRTCAKHQRCASPLTPTGSHLPRHRSCTGPTFAGSQMHHDDSEMSALGRVSDPLVSIPILLRQRRSVGCFNYPSHQNRISGHPPIESNDRDSVGNQSGDYLASEDFAEQFPGCPELSPPEFRGCPELLELLSRLSSPELSSSQAPTTAVEFWLVRCRTVSTTDASDEASGFDRACLSYELWTPTKQISSLRICQKSTR